MTRIFRGLAPLCLLAFQALPAFAQNPAAPYVQPAAGVQDAPLLFPGRDLLFQNYPRSEQDETFLRFQRERAAKILTPESQAEMYEALRGYPLADYAVSWGYYDALKTDPADPVLQDGVLEFLKAHHGEYVAERLGTDAARLAAPAGCTEFFEKLYGKLIWNKTEPDLLAWHTAFAIEAGAGPEETENGLKLLRDAKNPHQAAFLYLANAVLMAVPGRVWDVAGFYIQHKYFTDANRLILTFSDDDPAEVNAIFASPAKWLSNCDASAGIPARHTVTALLLKACGDPEGAAEFADLAADSLSEADRRFIRTFIGYREILTDSASGAYVAFQKAGEGSPDPRLSQPDLVAEWRVKASLAVGNWSEVIRAVESMSPAARSQEMWVYWLGRAKRAVGNGSEADALFSSIAGNRTYYGKLSCDILGRAYPGDPPQKHRASETDIRQWMQNPGIIRSVLYRRLGQYTMASREWNWSLRGANNEQLMAASEYARRIGVAERMINTAQKLPAEYFRHDLSFPVPSEREVRRISEETGVGEDWIYGVTRQESRFMTAVASGAGAKGLMQLLPATARWTAKRYGLGDQNPDLSDPLTNMRLGSYYLKYLSEKFSGQLVLATAGYNAGPGRSAAWRKKLSSPMQGDVFTELIPFTETRNYVKAVLSNAAEYSRILAPGQTKRLSSMLGTIEPPDPE